MRLVELQQALRAADPAAVLVSSRVLDRVIQQVHKLPGLLWAVPHRRCFIVDRYVLFRHVEQDELDLDPEQLLPSTVILLARPPAEDLSLQERPAILLKYWRRLFHASVHVALARRASEGKLNPEDVRARIEQIGATEFEEIRNVLQQDYYLFPSADERDVYIEFAAVYLELRYFASNLLTSHFPGIRDDRQIEQLLARDLDAEALFTRTRLAGAPEPVPRTDTRSDEAHDYYWKLIHSAERAGQSGNTVRAAILRTRAARVAPAALTLSTRAQAEADVQRLMQRLQAALQLSDAEAVEWARDLPPLLDKADQGNHPVEAGLLYDLQTCCHDHEREIYTLDLVEWLLSAGNRPIKRPLPSQRQVRVLRHLRSATTRLATARLSDSDRQHFASLLQTALHQCEDRMRTRFRPVLVAAFQDVGLLPDNPPERGAFHKIIEELLDRITAHGFIHFSDLRDTLSGNQLKLPDLSDPQDFIRGDPLLRLDRRLANLLDGVYRPSEFYMRWLERLTAVGFGTHTGRRVTRFALLPFGGAFLITEGVKLIADFFLPKKVPSGDLVVQATQGGATGFVEYATTQAPERAVLPAPGSGLPLPGVPETLHLLAVLLLGCFLFGLMHSEPFRRRCRQIVHGCYHGLRLIFVQFPAWLVHATGVQYLVNTWPFQLFSWYLLKPLVACGFLAIYFRELFWQQSGQMNWPGSIISFLAMVFVINSRPGQAVSELIVQSVVAFYELLRAGLIPGLFRLVMHVFKQIIDMLEYILFTVDEWLRFRTGDGWGSMVMRTILGVLWFPVSYAVRFYTVVLVEPMLNPIKLPISILAAKFVYPLLFLWGLFDFSDLSSPLVPVLSPYLGFVLAWLLVIGTFYLMPDAFAFLLWELKENWSLYEANRWPTLRPEVIGSHGETLRGLLQPGFHSGTIPRLFTRLRHAEQEANRTGNWRQARAYREALHAATLAVEQFVSRELVTMVLQDASWQGQKLSVGDVLLASNRITVELVHASFPDTPLWLEFEQRSGWLLAGLRNLGWLPKLTSEQLQALTTTLATLYKLAGVDLVREQVHYTLPADVAHYDVTEQDLILWLDHPGGRGVTYDLLDQTGPLQPRGLNGAAAPDWPTLDAQQLIFARTSLSWQKWVESWQKDPSGKETSRPLDGPLTHILPSWSGPRSRPVAVTDKTSPRAETDSLQRLTSLPPLPNGGPASSDSNPTAEE